MPQGMGVQVPPRAFLPLPASSAGGSTGDGVSGSKGKLSKITQENGEFVFRIPRPLAGDPARIEFALSASILLATAGIPAGADPLPGWKPESATADGRAPPALDLLLRAFLPRSQVSSFPSWTWECSWSWQLHCLGHRRLRLGGEFLQRSKASETSAFPSATWERGHKRLNRYPPRQIREADPLWFPSV